MVAHEATVWADAEGEAVSIHGMLEPCEKEVPVFKTFKANIFIYDEGCSGLVGFWWKNESFCCFGNFVF